MTKQSLGFLVLLFGLAGIAHAETVCKEQRTDATHGYSVIISDDQVKAKVVEDRITGRIELTTLYCVTKQRPPSLAPDLPYTRLRCDETFVSFAGYSLDIATAGTGPLEKAHLYQEGITGADYLAVLDCFPPAPAKP